MAEPRRGELWVVDWSLGRGSEQLGRRPALVVQTDVANDNRRYPNTIVVTVSTKGLPVATHVLLQPDGINRLREVSYAKCEQLLTVSKERLEHRIGQLGNPDMARVENALRTVLVL